MIASLRRPRSIRRNHASVDPEEIFVDAALASSDPAHEVEGKLERPLTQRSSILFLVLMLGGMGYLFFRSFALQVSAGEDFFAASQENRFASRTVYSPRGMIRDRSGEALVENIPSLGIVFDRERFRETGGDINRLITGLGSILGKPREFFTDLGFPEDGDPRALPARIFIARDITREQTIVLAPRLVGLPGIEVFESFRRLYRDPYALSHLIGFVGKISLEDLQIRPELGEEETVGKTGIEFWYDADLRGASGRKIVEVDSQGIETRYRLTREAQPGTELALAIDGALQQTAYDVLKGYTAGKNAASVVILDPRSGAVRALVSAPGFDANRFGQSLEEKEFAAIVHDPLKPLFNRAVGGEFPSGSTIKPLFAAAAMEEHLIDPDKKIYDPGFLDIPNPFRPGERSRFLDWRAHGWVDLYDAIAYSANVYFYMIGGGYRDQKGLGIEKIDQYAAAFGLGSLLGIDLPGEKSGLVPGPEWKKSAEPEDPIWRIGDTYNVSIGQGGMKVTPLQMAAVTAAIANGGTLWRPYLLDTMRDAEGKMIDEVRPQVIRENVVSPESLEPVVKGMQDTVTRGTARLLGEVPVAVAAKTGTAQSAPGRKPHAWVIAFAPVEKPEVAIAVMVEYAGEGATVAVPITKEILKWYFTHNPS